MNDPGSLCGIDHGASARRVERHRLLANDVLTGVGDRDRLGCVHMVRARDVYDVDVGLLE